MHTITSLLEDRGIRPPKVSGSKGGEYASPCPGCGGDDRFRIWPGQNNGDGSYWCRVCGKRGDPIQFLMDFDGKTFPQAALEMGKELKAKPLVRRTGSKKDGIELIKESKSAKPDILPNATWQGKAAKLVDHAHEQLLELPEQLAWLKNRGIDIDAVKQFKLGWLHANVFRSRESWGLDTIRKADQKPKKLFIPQGLVIPWLDKTGRVIRLKVRRPDEVKNRYFMVPGSAAMPIATDVNKQAFVVVESELDAVLIAAHAGDLVGAVALGSVTTKPSDQLSRVLKKSLALLIALDFDTPGAKAFAWWKTRFMQSERWPTPEGKDPGEAFQGGVDIRAWIKAGLPPIFNIPEKLESISKSDEEKLAGVKEAKPAQDVPGANEKSEIWPHLTYIEKMQTAFNKFPFNLYVKDGEIEIDICNWALKHQANGPVIWAKRYDFVLKLICDSDELEEYILNHPHKDNLKSNNFLV